MNNKHTDRNEVVELIFAIQQMAHIEYHLLELAEVNIDRFGLLKDFISSARKSRVALMDILSEQRPNLFSLWCPFKHLILAEFSLLESYEKSFDNRLLEEASKARAMIDEMLGKHGLEGLKDCERCEDDKSIHGNQVDAKAHSKLL